jgi:hypothetical protein
LVLRTRSSRVQIEDRDLSQSLGGRVLDCSSHHLQSLPVGFLSIFVRIVRGPSRRRGLCTGQGGGRTKIDDDVPFRKYCRGTETLYG